MQKRDNGVEDDDVRAGECWSNANISSRKNYVKSCAQLMRSLNLPRGKRTYLSAFPCQQNLSSFLSHPPALGAHTRSYPTIVEMGLVVLALRCYLVFQNIYVTFKTLKIPPPSSRNHGQPSIRAMTQRKRDMKGCMAIWIVWVRYFQRS